MESVGKTALDFLNHHDHHAIVWKLPVIFVRQNVKENHLTIEDRGFHLLMQSSKVNSSRFLIRLIPGEIKSPWVAFWWEFCGRSDKLAAAERDDVRRRRCTLCSTFFACCLSWTNVPVCMRIWRTWSPEISSSFIIRVACRCRHSCRRGHRRQVMYMSLLYDLHEHQNNTPWRSGQEGSSGHHEVKWPGLNTDFY